MPRPRSPMLSIRRHPLGPRVYVAGLRVHECFAGLAAMAALDIGALTGHLHHPRLDAAVAVVGLWMMAKDWPDFLPSRRDTYAWSVGLHRRGQPVAERTRPRRPDAA